MPVRKRSAMPLAAPCATTAKSAFATAASNAQMAKRRRGETTSGRFARNAQLGTRNSVPSALLHLVERQQRVRVVVAQQQLFRIPLPGVLDDRHPFAFEEIGAPFLGRLDQVAQLEHAARGGPDLA